MNTDQITGQLVENITNELVKVLAQKGELLSTINTLEKRELELRGAIEGVKAVAQAQVEQAQALDEIVSGPKA